MFAQVFFAIVAAFLIYTGIINGSIFNIVLGSIALLMSLARFYAAKSGSSLQEEFDKWRAKRNNKINGE
jgi:hypothetical protein